MVLRGRAFRALALSAGLALAAGLLVVWSGRRSSSAAPGAARPADAVRALEPGDRPAMSLVDLAGRRHSIAGHRGRGIVLNVWATWCAPCLAEMPSLERLHRQGEVVVLAVAVDERREDVERVAREQGLSLPILLDPGGVVAASWGTIKFPETYLIDARGVVVERIIGAREWTSEEILGRVRSLR